MRVSWTGFCNPPERKNCFAGSHPGGAVTHEQGPTAMGGLSAV